MGYHAPLPSRFPFWSEVITQQHGSVNVPASSSTSVYIQPPSGETWMSYISLVLFDGTKDNYVGYLQYDGTSGYYHTCCMVFGSYGVEYPYLNVIKILTNSLYARLIFGNKDLENQHVGYYGYSGFKLGTKISEFEALNAKNISFERLTKYKIKSEFEGLEDLIKDVYDSEVDDYKQVIYFYKDRPIRKDKRTGHIIERASRYIETDKLIENLEKVKTGELQLEKTGYKSWLEWIKKERGIDLLERL